MQFAHLTLLVLALSAALFFQRAGSTCSRDPGLGRQRMLEAVKQEILFRLGLDEEPNNPPEDPSELEDPEFLEGFELSQEGLNGNAVPCASLDFRDKGFLHYHPTQLIRSRPAGPTAFGDECISDKSVHFYSTYKFKFDIDLSKKDLKDARLRLTKSLLDSSSLTQDKADRIDIYLVSRPDNYYGEELRRFVKFALLDIDDINGRVIFNVTKAISWWLDDPDQTLTRAGEIEFEVSIRCPQPLTEGVYFIPNFQFFADSSQDGELILTYEEESGVESSGEGGWEESSRRKRRDDEEDLVYCNQDQFVCCLNELRINFRRDFNWTWVIVPTEIAFNYCSGACINSWDTEHSQFLHTYREKAKHNPTAAPEPCCVPNSYATKALGVRIGGENSIQQLDDIVATSCACR